MDFGRESGNDAAAMQVIHDYREASLEPADVALCAFAVKLTLEPHAMDSSDLDRLREHGFDDDAITIATQVVGYFNYINRVADALGVDPEDGMTPAREVWERARARDW